MSNAVEFTSYSSVIKNEYTQQLRTTLAPSIRSNFSSANSSLPFFVKSKLCHFGDKFWQMFFMYFKSNQHLISIFSAVLKRKCKLAEM